MTVVLGVVSGNRTYLLGDSFLAEEGSGVYDIKKRPKVYKVNRYTSIGYCGDTGPQVYFRAAITQIMKERKRIGKDYFEDAFQADLIAKLKELGFPKADQETIADVGFLIGRPGRLYYMDSSLSVHECVHPYAAIGAGREPAMGALALAHKTHLIERAPERAIQITAECVADMSPYVSRPFTVVEV